MLNRACIYYNFIKKFYTRSLFPGRPLVAYGGGRDPQDPSDADARDLQESILSVPDLPASAFYALPGLFPAGFLAAGTIFL